jgi:peroxiredoxin
VQFVGVALDDINAVKRFLTVIPIDYPVLIGDDEAIPIAKAYGNSEGVLPYTVFIDKQGNIISIAEGGLSEDIAESTLKKLF